MTGQPDPIVHYWDALEADLARFYRLTPDRYATMSWRELSCYIASLWAVEGSVWAELQRRRSTDGGQWVPPGEPNLAGSRPRPVDIVRRAFADARKVHA